MKIIIPMKQDMGFFLGYGNGTSNFQTVLNWKKRADNPNATKTTFKTVKGQKVGKKIPLTEDDRLGLLRRAEALELGATLMMNGLKPDEVYELLEKS